MAEQNPVRIDPSTGKLTATPPNPKPGFSNIITANKKLIIIIIAAVAGLLVLFVGIKIVTGMMKQNPHGNAVAAKAKQTGAKSAFEKKAKSDQKELESENESAVEEVSVVPLKPSQIKERENKIAGTDAVSALEERNLETALGQATAASPAAGGQVSSGTSGEAKLNVYRPSSFSKVKIKRKKTFKRASIPELAGMMLQALQKGDEPMMTMVLSTLEYKGEDTVNVLRKIILDNYSDATIRRNAALGLFYSDQPEAVPVLKTMATVDPSEDVRFMALFALNGLAGRENARFFAEVADKDASQKVKDRARDYYNARSKDQ